MRLHFFFFFLSENCMMNYAILLILKNCILIFFSPCNLYRLAVVFLAFDVFFAVFCVALACLIGIALCCCLPCIIGILYAVAGQVCFFYSDRKISITWLALFFFKKKILTFCLGGCI